MRFMTGAETLALGGIAAIIAASHPSAVVMWASVLSPIIAAAVGAYLAFRLRQVHVIVNSQRTALEQRIVQLETTIESSDKDVPATTRETGRT